mmetsp:Transcript_7471/g.24942  ORF Transcript_7471/g.24942 Transcript_7471/m.24942 type:complete len:280 (-) Transcript_7471:24-863(-)
MRGRFLNLLRGAAVADFGSGTRVTSKKVIAGFSAPTSRCDVLRTTSKPRGSMRTAPPAARADWTRAAGLTRGVHTTAKTKSVFDTFKSALFGAGASFAIPDSFSLDDLVSLSKKVKDETGATSAAGMISGEQNASPLATLGLSPLQIEGIVTALTETEQIRPGLLRAPEHRRVAFRVNEKNPDLNVNANDVASCIQHAAMLQVVMRRVKKSLAGGAAPPMSWEGFADIVRKSQTLATKEELREDAKSMDGAFPATRPCPCQSGRRYKSCCSPFRGGLGK